MAAKKNILPGPKKVSFPRWSTYRIIAGPTPAAIAWMEYNAPCIRPCSDSSYVLRTLLDQKKKKRKPLRLVHRVEAK